MIDKKYIGMKSGPHVLDLERGRVRSYSKILGFTDPVYFDVPAAKAAGYPDLLVPPTFLFGLEIETDDIYSFFRTAGVDLGEVLHGEEEFIYHRPLFAGDTVTLETTITDLYEKKNGQLEFIVRHTVATRNHEKVVEMKSITVVNHR